MNIILVWCFSTRDNFVPQKIFLVFTMKGGNSGRLVGRGSAMLLSPPCCYDHAPPQRNARRAKAGRLIWLQHKEQTRGGKTRVRETRGGTAEMMNQVAGRGEGKPWAGSCTT